MNCLDDDCRFNTAGRCICDFAGTEFGCKHFMPRAGDLSGPLFAREAEAVLGLIESDFGQSGRDVRLESIRVELERAHDRGRSKQSPCPDCGVAPGQAHQDGCDVERCSACGGQLIMCGCDTHDKAFARWTGFWPGSLEADAMGIDLNTLYQRGLNRTFFVKPAHGQAANQDANARPHAEERSDDSVQADVGSEVQTSPSGSPPDSKSTGSHPCLMGSPEHTAARRQRGEAASSPSANKEVSGER